MKKSNLKSIAFLFFLIIVVGCNNDDDGSPQPCLEEPCGTIVDSSTNLTILNEGQNITFVEVTVGAETFELSLDGWNFENENFYTCWTTIPDITSNTPVLLQYTIEGEVIAGVLNSTFVTSNTVVIEIVGDGAELMNFEECED